MQGPLILNKEIVLSFSHLFIPSTFVYFSCIIDFTEWTVIKFVVYRHTLFYCTLLYYALQVLHFFTNWKSVATLHQTSILAPVFQQQLLNPSLSLGHILVILSIFQFFSLLLYLLWWSVTTDFWYYLWTTTIFTLMKWQTWLMNVVCVVTAPPTRHPLIFLPLLRSPYSLRHNDIEIRPNSNLTMDSKFSSERKNTMSLTLNQKLEMIILSKEGML